MALVAYLNKANFYFCKSRIGLKTLIRRAYALDLGLTPGSGGLYI